MIYVRCRCADDLEEREDEAKAVLDKVECWRHLDQTRVSVQGGTSGDM